MIKGMVKQLYRKWIRVGVAYLAAFSLLFPMAAFAIQSPFFTVVESSFTDLSAFTKWTSVWPRYAQQKKRAARDCKGASCSNQKWEALLTSLKGRPLKEKMQEVNRFFNAIPYVEDIHNFGMQDYWQTPYELMKNGGDCEDYAIAKYISLKRLGVAESSMRIMIVQDNNLGGIMHAVLEVRSGNQRYLLDNQAKTVTNQASIFHYRPVYAINNKAWWAYQ